MSVVDLPAPPQSRPAPQEAAWRFAEGEAAAVMGTVNVAVARLVAAVRGLLDTDGWEGVGIQSPEHWLCWKAGVSRARAEGLVTVARRARELPECWALFESGRLGEDAMVRIARRVPASRDAEVAALAQALLIAQLDRLLRSLPDQPGGTEPRPEPERMLRLPDPVARFLSCDAQIQVMAYRLGQLIGIHPTERTPNRALRRYLARRDQGCTHPLCTQRLWLHAHHIRYWEHGGPTEPHNLVLLCPRHHRALHLGQFSIEGNPEERTLRFPDHWGQPIVPPGLDPPDPGPPDGEPPPPYAPPWPNGSPPTPSPGTDAITRGGDRPAR